eukprot:TRINITY_DN8715_c0_g1_i1.p1 TRINITY_DN8715_c0_g1~~TRINITY_DN8715_c0_g1_i1.p1  ORF type:complete len:660 (-),score=187.43 TRINITY_DN8715_c0_g1_i1:10-1989(-)
MGGSNTKPIGPKLIRLPAERDGESEVFRHPGAKDGLIKCLDDEILTLHVAFENASKKYPNNNCLGVYKADVDNYQWITYKTAYSRAVNIAAGLINLGLKPGEDKVGIYSQNRLEWVLAQRGIYAYSLCVVPLYDTLGPDACAFIVNQAELKVVLCSGDKVKLLITASDKMPALKTVVHFDKVDEEVSELAAKKGVTLVHFSDVEQSGLDKPVAVVPPKPSDLAVICYTSGTTGDPKGVMISHENFISDVAGAVKLGIDLRSDDVYLSYLPLAHVLEQILVTTMMYFGGSVGFFRGEIPKLFEDIQKLRPTIFASVPRVFNRLYNKVTSTINEQGELKKTIFQKAYDSKLDGLKEGSYESTIWDKVVFSTFKEKLGGRVRIMLTGSAPISQKVLEFLRIAFCCPVLEGYGQTETCAGATITLPSDTIPGHVGVPVPCMEYKLVDVPEMNYFATDKPHPRGEICFRGYNCTTGYYKSKEKTEEAIDKYGWLHSGDIGSTDDEGNLRIIDRKKNIFKLSIGEYIAPEKIENVYVQSKYVAQVFVYGDSLKSVLVAIVVPDVDVMKAWAKENNKPEDLAQLCKDQDVYKLITDDMNAVGKANELRGFENVKGIYLSSELFSVENDILTPTFKIKRPQAKNAYIQQINDLYQSLEKFENDQGRK